MYRKRRYNNVYSNSSSQFRTNKRYKRYNADVALNKQVNKLIDNKLESKYNDIIIDSVVTSAGIIVECSQIAQGTTDSGTRIGDKIMWTKLHGKFHYKGVDEENIFRFIWFQWHDDDTYNAPAMNKILQDTSYPWVSPYHHDKGGSFTILEDKLFTTCNNTQGQGDLSGTFEIAIYPSTNKWAKRKIRYTQSTAFGTNKIFMLMIANSPTSTHPQVEYGLRLNYKDA